MDARAQARRLLEIDAALTRNEFEVHYRPIHDLKADQIIAFEALIRWNRIIRCEA
jgi:sensor c-di-GMP phosphodiesterase-like protein